MQQHQHVEYSAVLTVPLVSLNGAQAANNDIDKSIHAVAQMVQPLFQLNHVLQYQVLQ